MAAPVLIMAGGTGGHIFPGLAVAAALRARDVPVAWLGARVGLEGRLVPAADIEMDTLEISGLRGKGLRTLLAAPMRLLRALLQARSVFVRRRPRCAVSFGGYAAGPGGVMAWLTGCPLLVHEQNSVAGMTNRVLARLARRVLCGFPDALPKGEWVGNPVRETIATVLPPAQRRALQPHAPLRVLVLGGSQGARALNEGVPKALAGLPVDVRHQCGDRLVESARTAYREAGVDVALTPFIEHMEEAYAWADLVVCRAGALTIAELAAVGVAALLVPFPHAVDDHQTRNADWLVAAGAAERLDEGADLVRRLAERIATLASDRPCLLRMAEAGRALARTDAAERVADACLAEART